MHLKRIAFLLYVCCGPVFAQPIDTISRIDQLFSSWNNSTPGGSVLVARGNKIVYHKAYGLASLELNVPNTTETIFEAGSVSKQFTAYSILLLEKEGKLKLTDDVRKYVPELPVYEVPITIQMLLNHTSGLKDWGSIGGLSGWPRTTRVYTLDLALQIMSRQKTTNFKPGNEYSYSNSNYSLLVIIVERLSKQSLEDFTTERLFKPLGMSHTRWRSNFRDVVPNRSQAYGKNEGEYELVMPFENIHGHGGLLTTTGDLLKWNQLLEVHDGLYNKRTERGKLNDGSNISYAAGIQHGDVNGVAEIAHSGATAGYRAWLAYYPSKKISVVLLSNDGSFGPVTVGKKVAEVFLGSPKPADVTMEEKVEKPYTPDADLAGSYYSEEAQCTIQIVKEGSSYFAINDALERMPLQSFGNDSAEFDYATLSFKRDKKKSITGFNLSVSRANNVPFTKIK